MARYRASHPTGRPPGGQRPGLADPAIPLRRDVRDAWQPLRNPAGARWLAGTLSDITPGGIGPEEAFDQPVLRSPFIQRYGRQSLRTFFSAPLGYVRRDPTLILDALTTGTRVSGCIGELLDHSAHTAGLDPVDPGPWGVPGVTWLATMALPILPVRVDRHGALARCWYRYPGTEHRPGRRRMAWPMWRTPLNLPMVQTLLDHPNINPNPDPTVRVRWEVDLAGLTSLGVLTVFGGERRQKPGSK
ncbi:hypothetical protein [Micromonospora sp. WMMD1082]|uniref:type I-G CRISPR-associated protein, Cas3-extension family n=1 Tax=Micromonospora sp. WMMD1082 TaxID=3016104 RepID=UPI002415F006|nr:hypothetical protein [Micromonospora sp. WMMD1082]MDG4795097.1 hypothetical protein [Micromonospora sp. WMMD1082]